MTRSPVQSSNLKSIGYDPASRTLEIEFKDGGVHQFDGVSAIHHANLLKAISPGAYFHTHIRKAHLSRKLS